MSTPFHVSVIAEIWNLADAGIDTAIDQIRATGATGLTVQVTSGPVAQLRCQAVYNPRVFRSDGGYFYQTDDAYYVDTHLRPVTASWLRQRNPLDAIAREATASGLELSLRISAFNIGRMAARYPDTAAKTVLGDPATTRLCPANPDVRALIAGTVRELSERYVPAAIEITDIGYESGAIDVTGVDVGFDPPDAMLSLLGVCFSESSRQWAAERGVDVAAAARWFQVHLDRMLTASTPDAKPFAELLADADIPIAYMQAQRDALDELLNRIIAETACPVTLCVPMREPLVFPSPQCLSAADAIVIAVDDENFESPNRVLSDRYATVSSASLELETASIIRLSPQHLVSAVKSAADAGHQGISLGRYGMIPPDGFNIIKQAIRYGQRSSV